MPIPTDFEIKCRGCPNGDFVPLYRKDTKKGVGRFYYGHGRGCLHSENFDPAIEDGDTLMREVPDIDVRRKCAIPLTKGKGAENTTAVPLAKGTAPDPKPAPDDPPDTTVPLAKGEGGGNGFFGL